MNYRIRKYMCKQKTSEILEFKCADDVKKYLKTYISENAFELLFGGIKLTAVYDGISEKDIMENVTFGIIGVLTIGFRGTGFRYLNATECNGGFVFKHNGISARDTASDILKNMKDVVIDGERYMEWKLTFKHKFASEMYIEFSFPYIPTVKPSFDKIESLKKQLREKDIEIASLKKISS